LKKIIGLDIGGANLKAALLGVQDCSVKYCETGMKFFPVWRERKERLAEAIKGLRTDVGVGDAPSAVGVTMTAELSDAFFTKREGVNHVLRSVEEAFPDAPLRVLDVYCKFLSPSEVRRDPYSVAAANWPATAWLASQFFENCIVIDVGSTTTSIIPVIDGAIAADGRNDFDKLANGELVYTGCLRTNVATIVNSVPLRGRVRHLASELFALSGDIHLILGNIIETDYSTETADGRGKSRTEVFGRLARAVCADIEMLSEQEIEEMATYIYEKQIEEVSQGLGQVRQRILETHGREVSIVVTGMGRDFLARRAAERNGCDTILDLSDYIDGDAALTSTSVGVAWMLATELEGRLICWKR
jgi:hypothetical protein